MRTPLHKGALSCRAQGDEGLATLFAVLMAFAMLVGIGLAVDGAGKVRAIQQADNAAAEAARAAGQQLQVPPAVRGDAVTLDTAAAAQAARSYLSSAGIEGTVSVSGETVRITTTAHYEPVFLNLINVGRQDVTGTAAARPVRGIDQEGP